MSLLVCPRAMRAVILCRVCMFVVVVPSSVQLLARHSQASHLRHVARPHIQLACVRQALYQSCTSFQFTAKQPI